MKRHHAGECTIYASLVRGTPEDGICTCGYGWQLARGGDWSQMYSEERREKMRQDYENLPVEERTRREGLIKKLLGDIK